MSEPFYIPDALTADVAPSPNGQRDHHSVDVASYQSTCLADVVPERVQWVWPGRLPAGKLVTLDGPPGVGKSTLALDVAARITRGEPLPGEARASIPASSVVLMSAEDGLADTIRPRLDAAGANVSLIHHFDSVNILNEEGKAIRSRPPIIPDDLDELAALVTKTGAVLVVVDVLMAYLSGSTNAHRDQDVRSALARLAAVADRTGACIVVLRHLRKAGGDAITAGGGSIGIIGAAHAGLVVALDPDDETESRRVVAVAKSNLAAKPPALAYTLTTTPEQECARVEWKGETSHTADQLVAPRGSDEDRTAVGAAADWLRDVLSGGEARMRRDVIKDGKPEGHAERTLERAAQRLGVVSERDEKLQGRPSTWRLP